MTYQVQNSDNSLTFIISDNVVDDGSLSLALIGRNVSNYGQYIARNTIHHLENFASAIAPSNPLVGQIWYDKTPGSSQLRVWTGTAWDNTSGISLGNLSSATDGDVLYYNGTQWVPGFPADIRKNATQKFGALSGMYAVYGDTYIDYYTSGNTIVFKMMQNGTFHADGDIIAYSTSVGSDERLKTDIKVVEQALEKICTLRGVEFTYKANGRKSAGLIAQDVEKILPQAVNNTELPLMQNDGEKYKTLQYDQLFSLLVEAVKELAQRVERLETANG